jgi:hypothetical protein
VSTTAGFSVSVKGRRVYLIEQEPCSDPGMSHFEATELGQRLIHAAAAAKRASDVDRVPDGAGQGRRTIQRHDGGHRGVDLAR